MYSGLSPGAIGVRAGSLKEAIAAAKIGGDVVILETANEPPAHGHLTIAAAE